MSRICTRTLLVCTVLLSSQSALPAGAGQWSGLPVSVEPRQRVVILAPEAGVVTEQIRVGSVVRERDRTGPPIARIQSEPRQEELRKLQHEIQRRKEALAYRGWRASLEVPPSGEPLPAPGDEANMSKVLIDELTSDGRALRSSTLLPIIAKITFVSSGEQSLSGSNRQTYDQLVARARGITFSRPFNVVLQREALRLHRSIVLAGIRRHIALDPFGKTRVAHNDMLLWDSEIKRIRVQSPGWGAASDPCGALLAYWRAVEEQSVQSDEDLAFLREISSTTQPESISDRINADCENVRVWRAPDPGSLSAEVTKLSAKWKESEKTIVERLAASAVGASRDMRTFFGTILQIDGYRPRPLGIGEALDNGPGRIIDSERSVEFFLELDLRKDLEVERSRIPEVDAVDALRNVEIERLARIELNLEEWKLARALFAQIGELRSAIAALAPADEGRVWPSVSVEVVEHRVADNESVVRGDVLTVAEVTDIPILRLPQLETLVVGANVRVTVQSVSRALLPATTEQRRQIFASPRSAEFIDVLRRTATQVLTGRSFLGEVLPDDDREEGTRVALREAGLAPIYVSSASASATSDIATLRGLGFLGDSTDKGHELRVSAGGLAPGAKLVVSIEPASPQVKERQALDETWQKHLMGQ